MKLLTPLLVGSLLSIILHYSQVTHSKNADDIEPNLKELVFELKEVDWIELGVQLNIPEYMLNNIRIDHQTEPRRLLAMFQCWLDLDNNISWKTIVIALASFKPKYDHIISEICLKYLKSTEPPAMECRDIAHKQVTPYHSMDEPVLLSLCIGFIALIMIFKCSQGNGYKEKSRYNRYGTYIRNIYRSYHASTLLKWPKLPTYTFITLAMIMEEKLRYGMTDDDFIRLTIRGKIDDILFRKKQVKLENIFNIDNEVRKVILIEGAPGAGKSTLAWHICKEWQCGNLFQEYDLIIYVQFRDLCVQKAKEIADILPKSHSHSINNDDVMQEILENEGKGVLFLLDGWDELPMHIQQQSIFLTLIKYPDKLGLHQSAVIVTSRPISSGKLQDCASSRIEIIGFTQVQIENYFFECLQKDMNKMINLMSAIKINPLVESSCYLPLNAAIIIFIFLSDRYQLPTTLHDIYTSLVFHCICRYSIAEADKGRYFPEFSSLSDLPNDIQDTFDKVCALAFYGIVNDVYLFTDKQLREASIPSSFDHLGLMQAVQSFVQPLKYTYNFLHLSVQELLAAMHISTKSSQEQLAIFHKLFGHPRFITVFQFYAGLTKLRGDGIEQLLSETLRSGRSKGKSTRMGLLRCLYETQDPSLCCQFLPMYIRRTIHFSSVKDPVDCLAVGFFLSSICLHYDGEFKLKLRRWSIDDNGIKFLVIELKKNTIQRGFLNIDLCGNSIYGKGAKYLSQLLKTSHTVRKLTLSENNLQKDREDGPYHLFSALAVLNSFLSELHLSSCSLVINSKNGPMIVNMLQKNQTLQTLDLSFNKEIGDLGIEYIANGILENRGLKTLKIRYIGITAVGAKYLGEALSTNSTLSALYLSHNRIRDKGLRYIARGLACNKALKNLQMCDCNLSASGIENLSDVVTNTPLMVLNLSSNPLSGLNGRKLMDLSLRALYLQNANLKDRELALLSENLRDNQSLRLLDLQVNVFTDGGLTVLAKALQPKVQLRTLRLYASLQTRSDKEIICFVSSMESSTLENIHLSPEFEACVKSEVVKVNIQRESKKLPQLRVHYCPAQITFPRI